MIRALENSASGMAAQAAQVDILAHDLANVNTPGYKKSCTGFADLVYRAVEERGMPVNRPEEPAVGSGVRLSAVEKDFVQGALVETGNPLHLAIQGQGFFALEGPAGELYLTRDGSFHLNEAGEVVHTSGYRLLPPVMLDPGDLSLKFTTDGRVLAVTEAGEEVYLADLDLYIVPNPAGLEAVGDNLFRITAASGDAVPVRPGESGSGYVRPGWLEASNVDLAESLTKMILAQRIYAGNSMAARVADEMWGMANNLRR